MNSFHQDMPPIEVMDESEEVLRIYRETPEMTLKTLVCRAYWPGSKSYLALVTIGSQSADFVRIERTLGLRSIRLATAEEMRKLGLVTGFVSPIECVTMKIVVDPLVAENTGYYDGANSQGRYRRNVSFPRDFQAWKVFDFARK